MDKICIIALVGLPAVGKTTLSNLLLKLDSLPFDILHVNYDDILNFKTDKDVPYKQQRAELLKDLQSMVKSLKVSKALNNNWLASNSIKSRQNNSDKILILCDDNHYYRSMRYKLCQTARLLNTSYGQIFIKSTLELASQRNNLRPYDSKVPAEVFERMYKNFETPQPEIYAWELDTLCLESSKICETTLISNVIPFVLKLFEKPLSVKNVNHTQTDVICFQSQVHRLDNLLRKKIGIFLSSHVDIDKKQIAFILNEKKNILLKEFHDDQNLYKSELFMKCVESFEEYLDDVQK